MAKATIEGVRLDPELYDFLLDLHETNEELRASGRVDPFLLFQTGPSYGLKPGPVTPRVNAHPGMVDELATVGLLTLETPTSRDVARKFRLTSAGRELGERVKRERQAGDP